MDFKVSPLTRLACKMSRTLRCAGERQDKKKEEKRAATVQKRHRLGVKGPSTQCFVWPVEQHSRERIASRCGPSLGSSVSRAETCFGAYRPRTLNPHFANPTSKMNFFFPEQKFRSTVCHSTTVCFLQPIYLLKPGANHLRTNVAHAYSCTFLLHVFTMHGTCSY